MQNPYAEAGYTYPNFQEWVAGTRTMPRASATVSPLPLSSRGGPFNLPNSQAVSVDATISFPITAGATTSVFFTNAYATGAATVGAAAAGTTAAGGGIVTTGSGTAVATASASTKAAGARRKVGSAGPVVGLAMALGGLLAGAVLI